MGLLGPGAMLAWTDGAAGGRLAKAGADGRVRSQRWAAVPPARQVDPTGAGDVFLATLVASLVRPDLTGRRAGRR